MRLACVLLPIASAFLGPTQRNQAPLRATTDDETAPPLLKIPIPGSATATLEVPALADADIRKGGWRLAPALPAWPRRGRPHAGLDRAQSDSSANHSYLLEHKLKKI